MNITTVEAGYSETVSLPNYSNVEHSCTLRAEVQQGEEPMNVEADMHSIAKDRVQTRIDRTLIDHGKAPKYYDGQTYEVLDTDGAKLIVICPDDIERPAGFYFNHKVQGDFSGLTIEQARSKAERFSLERDREIIECLDGDFSEVKERIVELKEEDDTFEPDDEMPF